MSWPDLEAAFVTGIPLAFPDLRAGVETGSDLDKKLPFVRLQRLPGRDDGITDFVRMDFDVFASTYTEAKTIASELRDWIKPRLRVGSATLDSVRTDASPHKVPWDNVSVSRVLATYQISVRR